MWSSLRCLEKMLERDGYENDKAARKKEMQKVWDKNLWPKEKYNSLEKHENFLSMAKETIIYP